MQRKLAVLWVLGMLLLTAGVAAAGPITVGETPLMPYGEAYEVRGDPSGVLWVSDYGGEIRKIDPAGGAYAAYPVNGAVDAQPDASARIWYTDSTNLFGYLSPGAGQTTTWLAGEPGEVNLWGVAFDGSGRVWMPESFGSASKLWSFNPSSRQLCGYALTGGVSSYYALYRGGALWLANWSNDRIIKFVPGAGADPGTATWWPLPADSSPRGLAFDAGGNLWFADHKTKALRRFQESGNTLTTYLLPSGAAPRMVLVIGEKTWYTETGSGTAGFLDPSAASGAIETLAPESESITPTCTTLAAGSIATAAGVPGNLAWTANSWPQIYGAGGWTVYDLPEGSYPWGIAAYSGRPWVVDQGRALLADMSTPPALPRAPQLSISISSNHPVLTWPPVTQDTNGAPVTISKYQVWRSQQPYFVPGAAPDFEVAGTTTTFTDPDAITGQGLRYAYIVRALSATGLTSGDSNRPATFTFQLVRGS